ncbi:MAG TPA: hypothetical protein PLL18_03390 [Flavobacteriales bacterium]|nr:hypothetical protein [Flavobacteriales bacterium]
MNEGVSKPDGEGLRKRLDEAVVLQRTVLQLRKDLRDEELPVPALGEGAFEALRARVLAILQQREKEGAHALGLVVNRVHLTERQVREATAAGGLHALAGSVVLRCLQKVLSRMRFAGLG